VNERDKFSIAKSNSYRESKNLRGYMAMVEIKVRNLSAIFEDRAFCRLLIAIPLKMHSKIGQPKWILVGQMLKLVRKWPMANYEF